MAIKNRSGFSKVRAKVLPISSLEQRGDVVLAVDGVVLREAVRGQPLVHHVLLEAVDLSLALFALGGDSIDIWILRLELGRKLRQGLKTRLGTYYLFMDKGKG